MANIPDADIRIDEALVSRLLDASAPEFAGMRPIASGNGFDNCVYRLGEKHAIRLPRREIASALIESEQEWLPRLSEGIPTATPVTLIAGTPSADFPRPWSIVAWIEGSPVTELAVPERGALAPALAEFVATFQRAAPASAPTNAYRGCPLAHRDHSMRERLSSGVLPDSAQLEHIWDQALRAPEWAGLPLWLHGDLHPANLIHEGGALSGVIDFGDLTAGDPATDVAVAWLALDREGREIFFDRFAPAYDVDEQLLERAQGWALLIASTMAVHSDDSPELAAIATHTFEQLLGEERALF